jgi:hypothetical protein
LLAADSLYAFVVVRFLYTTLGTVNAQYAPFAETSTGISFIASIMRASGLLVLFVFKYAFSSSSISATQSPRPGKAASRSASVYLASIAIFELTASKISFVTHLL